MLFRFGGVAVIKPKEARNAPAWKSEIVAADFSSRSKRRKIGAIGAELHRKSLDDLIEIFHPMPG